jgi:hypothetical protein
MTVEIRKMPSAQNEIWIEKWTLVSLKVLKIYELRASGVKLMEQKPSQKAKQESILLKNITEQEIVSQSVAAEALQILQNKFKIHLIWASVVLVVIGWFGYTSLQEVKNEVIQKAEDVAEQQVSEILDSIEAEVENVSEKVLVQVENATRATMEAEIQTAASKRALDELSNIEVSMRRNLSEIDAAFVEIEKNNKQLLQNGEFFQGEMVEIKLAGERLGKRLSEFEDEMSKMDSDLDGLAAQIE